MTPSPVSLETIRRALDHQSRSPVCVQNKPRDRLIRLAARPPDRVLGVADETWWSRVAQPALHSWTVAKPLRRIAPHVPQSAPAPNAVTCYGLLRTETPEILRRCVDGRPVRHVTAAFLAWLCERLAAERQRVLVRLWDNASWHRSREVRTWIRAHHHQVKPHGGVRLLVWWLPVNSPWLHPIEPHWRHGKRAIVEPAGLLSAAEIIARVCAHCSCEHVEHLTQRVA